MTVFGPVMLVRLDIASAINRFQTRPTSLPRKLKRWAQVNCIPVPILRELSQLPNLKRIRSTQGLIKGTTITDNM